MAAAVPLQLQVLRQRQQQQEEVLLAVLAAVLWTC